MCRGERAVLTGDFNVGQTSESYAVLRDSKLLFDACDLAELRYAETGTENGFDPDRKTFRCIDYLFVTEGFRVLRYGILTDTYRTKEPAGSAKPLPCTDSVGSFSGAGRTDLRRMTIPQPETIFRQTNEHTLFLSKKRAVGTLRGETTRRA